MIFKPPSMPPIAGQREHLGTGYLLMNKATVEQDIMNIEPFTVHETPEEANAKKELDQVIIRIDLYKESLGFTKTPDQEEESCKFILIKTVLLDKLPSSSDVFFINPLGTYN